MPDSQTSLTQQLIIDSHPKLKSAVEAFNKENLSAKSPSPVAVKAGGSVSGSTGSNVTSSTTVSSGGATITGATGNLDSSQSGSDTISGNSANTNQPENESSSNKGSFPAGTKVEPSGSGNVESSNEGQPSGEQENQNNSQSGSGINSGSDATTDQSKDESSSNNGSSPAGTKVEPSGSGNVESSNEGQPSGEQENQNNSLSDTGSNSGSDATTDQSEGESSSNNGRSPTGIEVEPSGSGNNEPSNQGQPTTKLSELESEINFIVDGVTKQISLAAKIEAATQSKTVVGSAQDYLSSLTGDGDWKDLDYSQPSSAIEHLKRLEAIAAAYKSVDGKTLNIDAVVNALTYWINQKIALTGWWAEFGEFHSLAKTALFLGSDISPELKNSVAALIPTNMNTEKSGLNGTDAALANLYYGLLKSEVDTIRNSIQEISTIIDKLTVQGEQPDWSVLLTTQLDSGKTGEELFYELLNLVHSVNIGLKDSTSELKFSRASTEVLASILLDEIRWMESLSNSSTETSDNNDESYKAALEIIAALVPTREAEINKPLSGFKQFSQSNSTLTVTENFAFGIEMDSISKEPRLNNSDDTFVNFWSGLGGTSFSLVNNVNKDNTPIVELTKVPGTTTAQYNVLPTYDNQSLQYTEFFGGVSNGVVGVTTMSLNVNEERPAGTKSPEGYVWYPLTAVRDYLRAKKSWFSFGDQIVVLGAGISSTHLVPIYTTIDQSILNQNVVLSNRQVLSRLGDENSYGLDWVHHDQVGYVFKLRGIDQEYLSTGVTIKAIEDSGNETSRKAFTLTIDHDVHPQDKAFRYVILPNKTLAEMDNYQQHISVEVLHNDGNRQVVEDSKKKIISAVFFQPGEFITAKGIKVEVDRPCALILDLSGEQKKVTLSTPGLASQTVNVKVTTAVGTDPIDREVITPAQVGNSILVNL
nr:polysaccharide lyase family 8 super-sandwich domain-containing protein [Vibrio diazotrophicus]